MFTGLSLKPVKTLQHPDLESALRAEVLRSWSLTDQLFAYLVRSRAMEEQPIDLRNQFVFYYGHLACFYNLKVLQFALGEPSFDSRLDLLTTRGRDPNVDDPSKVHGHSAIPTTYPSQTEFDAYIAKSRTAFHKAYDLAFATGGLTPQHLRTTLGALQHDAMHLETLCYMLAQRPPTALRAPSGGQLATPPATAAEPPTRRTIRIPAGSVRLGADEEEQAMLWDQEMPAVTVACPEFEIESCNVTNAEYAEFVRQGHYLNPAFWRPAWWKTREAKAWSHPQSWLTLDGQLYVRRAFAAPVPLAAAADWPVLCSLAEAEAYAAWKGRRIASESELARAFYCTPEGLQLPYPWGDLSSSADLALRANCGWQYASATPVGMFPLGQSPFGLYDCYGSAWEWSSTPFAPLDPARYVPTDFYPEFSADFFDGVHFVLLGGSWASDLCILRSSFRNWYQGNYPYVFAKFRLAGNVAP